MTERDCIESDWEGGLKRRPPSQILYAASTMIFFSVVSVQFFTLEIIRGWRQKRAGRVARALGITNCKAAHAAIFLIFNLADCGLVRCVDYLITFLPLMMRRPLAVAGSTGIPWRL